MGDDGKSLVSIKDVLGLSDAAKILIEKVASATGILFEPTRIRRRARAEADAKKILRLADLELTELEERGLERLISEEAKRQENIEHITADAARQLGHDARPNTIDDDWLTHFFEKARIVSDQEMQSLWSRLLAGEATKPGTYSKRTVELVGSLDKSDAQLFTNMCTFAWQIGRGLAPLIYAPNDPMYREHQIDFNALQHLDSIGLVKFMGVGTVSRVGLPKEFIIFYYGTPIGITFPGAENNFDVGQVTFTAAGEQLAVISGCRPSQPFFEYVLGRWRDHGLTLWSPIRSSKNA